MTASPAALPLTSPSADWVEVSDPRVMAVQPRVTVSMPTYNHEHYLPEAIESVIQQKVDFPYEMIVVDDGSVDNTRRVALDYQRRHPDKIRVAFGEKNVGPRANARRIRRLWRGKYVAPCEGDDYWDSETKLQEEVSFLESHPDYGLVHGGFRTRIGDTVHPYVPEMSPMPTGLIFERLLERNFVSTCTVCLRAALAREYEGSTFWDQDYLQGDYPLWLWMSRHAAVEYIDRPLAVYRRVPGSMMRSGFEASKCLALSARQAKLDFMREFGCSQDAERRALRESNLRIMIAAANAGDRDLFFSEFGWCRSHNPRAARRFFLLRIWLLMRLGLPTRTRLRARAGARSPARA